MFLALSGINTRLFQLAFFISLLISFSCDRPTHQIHMESFIADTPGFNKPHFDINPYSLGKLFPEIRAQLKNKKCKFRNCLHLDEPGCIISRNWERYDTYRNFVKEMINFHQ